MLGYIARRILVTIPVMGFVALFIFSLLYITPGDPAAIMAGEQAPPEAIERIRASMGLDQSFPVRFGIWIWGVLNGHLGVSIFSGMSVTRLIAQRLEPTLSLLALTLFIALAFAIPMGVIAAWKRGAWIDRAIMILAVIGFSAPVFVIGYALAFGFALTLEWLPVQGYSPIAQGLGEWLSHIILPACTLACAYIALIGRITRAAMLEVLNQDYIRTARSKGVSTFVILLFHALRNAAVPVVTIVGIGFTTLIGGAVVTESVFAIPGVGRLVVDAILQRDYPVIQGVVLMFSFLYVIVNLLIDLLYVIIDPRIRLR